MKNNDYNNALTALLNSASKSELISLLEELSENDNSVRRFCLEKLKSNCDSESIYQSANDSIALSYWDELEPELEELDEYGGGDYDAMDNVSEGLYNIACFLKTNEISSDERDLLLYNIFRFIKSGNAGMNDDLYDVAYSTSKSEMELRDLAERFLVLEKDWPTSHARGIYRQIKDNEKYLELRLKKMTYGMDYYDLTTFYWENDQKEKAIETAQEGMRSGEGRKDELVTFLADYAKNSGDRETYLSYFFEQKINNLTLEKYIEFKSECNSEEWLQYEKKFFLL